MNIIEAILLGILQGITEFLPVSSSGHLSIFKAFFGLKDIGITFDILLHVGTLIAVFIAFYKDIWELIVNGLGIIGSSIVNCCTFVHNLFSKNKKEYTKVLSTPYRRFAMLVIVSTIPTGIIGILFNDAIEKAGTYIIVPGICLLITGVLLLISDNVKTGKYDENTLPFKNSFCVGIAQGFATLPGISRSGTTITASLMFGFTREFAVKYSFIMSIPVILGAAILDIPDMLEAAEDTSMLVNYGAGMLAAAVVGYICIKTMLKVVRGKKLKGFAYYCFAMGIIASVAFFII